MNTRRVKRYRPSDRNNNRTVQRRTLGTGSGSKRNLLNFIALVLCCIMALVFVIVMITPKGEGQKKTPDNPSDITIQTAKSVDDLARFSYPEFQIAGFTTVPGFVPRYVLNEETKEYELFTLPTSNASLTIDSLGYYKGPYFENGSDITVEKALAIVVTNSSSSLIEKGTVVLQGDNRKLEFEINYLPARSTAVVINAENSTYDAEEAFTFVSYNGTATTSQDISGKLEVTRGDETIFIKNISDKQIKDLNIYYKNKIKGIYYGGIAYRSYLTLIEPESQSNILAQHYKKDTSEIVFYSFEQPIESSILDNDTKDNQNNN